MAFNALKFFSSRIVPTESGCWEWSTGRNSDGYGRVWYKGKITLAHRAAWDGLCGPIPQGLWVLHKCDNPPCVNPDHLFIGDRKDNMRDCASKGRSSNAFKNRTACLKGHEYTPENTYFLKKRNERVCKICSQERNKRYRQKLVERKEG